MISSIVVAVSKKRKKWTWTPIAERRERRELIQMLRVTLDAATRLKLKERLAELDTLRYVRNELFKRYPHDFRRGHPPRLRNFSSPEKYAEAAVHYRDAVDEVLAERILGDPARPLNERLRARALLNSLEEKKLKQEIPTFVPPKRHVGRPTKREKLRELQQQHQVEEVVEGEKWYLTDEDRLEDERETEARERFFAHMMSGTPLPSETKKEPEPTPEPAAISADDWCPHHQDLLVKCRCDSEVCHVCLKPKIRCAIQFCPRLREEQQQRRAIAAANQYKEKNQNE
jgi:hypothetical protein